MKNLTQSLMGLLLPAILAACATTSSGVTAGATDIRSGVVQQIHNVQIASTHHVGIGAVVGGAVGLGVGSLIGGGTGRDVAQVLGTVGGAVAGNEIQKKHDKPVAGEQIIVRLNNGVLLAVTQTSPSGLHVGQNVYVEGNGEAARVRPR